MDRIHQAQVIATAAALRIAIEQERRAKHAMDVARINRRNADEAILFRFEDAAAEKAYGKNEAQRKAQLRLDNATTYNAHKDAQTVHATAAADIEIARVNFEEATTIARLLAGVPA